MTLTPEQKAHNEASETIWALVQERDKLRTDNELLRAVLMRIREQSAGVVYLLACRGLDAASVGQVCTCHADEANKAIGNHFGDCPLR